METVLRRAAPVKAGNEGLPLDYALGNSIYNPKHPGAERRDRTLSHDFKTHEELHDNLRHSSLCNRLRPVEIAVRFHKDINDHRRKHGR